MAKIGTAHIELKPVVNEDALNAIVERIAEAVAEGVKRGMASAPPVINASVVIPSYEKFAAELSRRADRARKDPGTA